MHAEIISIYMKEDLLTVSFTVRELLAYAFTAFIQLQKPYKPVGWKGCPQVAWILLKAGALTVDCWQPHPVPGLDTFKQV